MLQFLELVSQCLGKAQIDLQECKGWSWGESEIEFMGLSLSVKQIKVLLPPAEPDFSKLIRKWIQFEPDRVWWFRWKKTVL